MRDINYGLFFLLLALAMLGNSLYGVISGQVFYPARHGGSVVIAQVAQPLLFWAVVAFCAIAGCITAIFGYRLLRGTE